MKRHRNIYEMKDKTLVLFVRNMQAFYSTSHTPALVPNYIV